MRKIILFCMMISYFSVSAQDRQFTYTYQSNVLNKGQKELEIWTTMRNTRVDFYRAFDHRIEFEVGLGKKLQTAFYLNYGYSSGITSVNAFEFVQEKTSFSFSNEWKLKLTDPVVNPVGSALYFEYKLSTEEVELESKLIFDKQTGNIIQALNLVGEYEFKTGFEQKSNQVETVREHELKLTGYYGFSYKINKNLALGFETINKNKFEKGDWKYSVFSAGPAISFNFEGFWLNVTCLPQIIDFNSKLQELSKNEKVQTRLIFSYVL